MYIYIYITLYYHAKMPGHDRDKVLVLPNDQHLQFYAPEPHTSRDPSTAGQILNRPRMTAYVVMHPICFWVTFLPYFS